MSQFLKLPDLTVQEYLAQEETSTVRNEYVCGQIFSMTGATQAHDVICVNFCNLLHNHLKGTSCRVSMHDMKVNVEKAKSFYYPDLMVSCEPYEGKSVFKRAPVLIVEVLSPSTSHIDRREKLVAYRLLESLKQYAIVHQNKFQVDLYQLASDNQWEGKVLTYSDSLTLSALSPALEVPVSAIYEDVILDLTVEEECDEYGFN